MKLLLALFTLLLFTATTGYAQIDDPRRDHLKPKQMPVPDTRSAVVSVPLQGCVDLVTWRETGIAYFPNNPELSWVEMRHPWDNASFAYTIRKHGKLQEIHCYTDEKCWFGSMAPVQGRPRLLYGAFPCDQLRSMVTFFNNVRLQQQNAAKAQASKPLEDSQ